MDSLKVVSWNVNGLNNPIKRRLVFDKLRKSKAQVMLLQETHSSSQSSKLWEQEWGGDIFLNHFSQNSRGVAILIDRQVSIQVLNRVSDGEGRFLGVDLEWGDDIFTACSVYAPTQDKSNEQIKFLDNIQLMLQDLNPINLLMGGDFNCLLDSAVNKNTPNPSPPSTDKVRASILSLINNLELSDPLRVRLPSRKTYTF